MRELHGGERQQQQRARAARGRRRGSRRRGGADARRTLRSKDGGPIGRRGRRAPAAPDRSTTTDRTATAQYSTRSAAPRRAPARAGAACPLSIGRSLRDSAIAPCSSTASPTRTARKLADIPVEDISEYVRRPDCFVWVALFEPTPEELDEMAEEFGLHPLAVEDARKGHQRPKIEEYDDSLFVVAADDRARARRRRRDDLLVGEVDVFVGTQLHPVGPAPDAEGLRRRARALRARAGAAAHGSGFVLYAIMDDDRRPLLPDPRRPRVVAGGRRGAGCSTAPRPRAEIEELYALKRRLMMLKHAVDAADGGGRQALRRARAADLCVGTQEYFRDVYDHLSRINAAIESIREMLTTAIRSTSR